MLNPEKGEVFSVQLNRSLQRVTVHIHQALATRPLIDAFFKRLSGVLESLSSDDPVLLFVEVTEFKALTWSPYIRRYVLECLDAFPRQTHGAIALVIPSSPLTRFLTLFLQRELRSRLPFVELHFFTESKEAEDWLLAYPNLAFSSR